VDKALRRLWKKRKESPRAIPCRAKNREISKQTITDWEGSIIPKNGYNISCKRRKGSDETRSLRTRKLAKKETGGKETITRRGQPTDEAAVLFSREKPIKGKEKRCS